MKAFIITLLCVYIGYRLVKLLRPKLPKKEMKDVKIKSFKKEKKVEWEAETIDFEEIKENKHEK